MGISKINLSKINRLFPKVYIRRTIFLLPPLGRVGVGQTQFPNPAFHPCLMHEVGGIHLQLIDVKLVDIHLTIKKRHQLHIYHSPFQVSYSILALR